MICFDLSQPRSFHTTKQKWLEELRANGYGDHPKIFVGLKKDLSSGAQEEITFNQSDQTIEEQYTICECSAKTGEGIEIAFEEAIRKYIYFDKEKEELHWRDIKVFAASTKRRITQFFDGVGN